MKRIRLSQLKFFGNRATINRRDGARLDIYQAGDDTYGVYFHPANTYPAAKQWRPACPLTVQMTIFEFQKGSMFDAGYD